MPRKGSFTPNIYRIEGKLVYLELTLGQEAIIDGDDLRKVLEYRWYAIRRDDINTYYVVTHNHINGSVMYLHRFLMDAPKGHVIDHINHNGLDNRRKNIRIVTQSKNLLNVRGAPKNSSLGILGVSPPMAKHKQGGKYTYYVYRFRCKCKECPVYKEFPATVKGFEEVKAYAEAHHAARIKK